MKYNKKKEYLDKIIEALTIIGQGDYSIQIPISEDKNEYDAIAIGINMMADEIKEGVEIIEEKIDFKRRIFSSMSDGLFVVNDQSEIIMVNEAWEEITGYKNSELIHKKASLFFEEEFYRELQDISLYPLKNIERSLIRKDGKIIPVLFSASVMRNKKGRISAVIAIVRDITDIKKTETELIEAKLRAEESTRIKEKFLANMSHEIRTPLNAILGFTRLMLKEDLNTRQKQYMQAACTASENLLCIINDILDLSKVESGRLRFEETEFSPAEVANNVMQLFAKKAEEKHIQFSLTIEEALISKKYEGDPTRLTQVLNNIVSNALKFTETGYVRLHLKRNKDAGEKSFLTFVIEDSGIGIPENHLETIFVSFMQASPDTTRKYGGTGLGLTIAKNIVEQQGGHIFVESRMTEGTKFTVNIPFKNLLSGSTIQKDLSIPANENINVPLKDIKILLVEDNPMNQLLTKTILLDAGCNNLVIADDGMQALDKLNESGDYNIILMDLQMPNMDGLEATKNIRSSFGRSISEIPIIALTADVMNSEEFACLQAGMNDYLSKPFKPNDLIRMIRFWTGKFAIEYQERILRKQA
jgi:PAS domain S-box-containing protein